MRYALDQHGDKVTMADVEEPTPVEWEVSGWTATGKKVSHYIKAVGSDEACELLLERYNSEGIMLEDTEATISEYQ